MAFPYPNTTSNVFINLFTYTDTITNGLFSILLILSIFLIGFISFRNWKEKGITASLFITFIVTSLLRFAGVVSPLVYSIVMFAFFGSIILLFVRKKQYE